MAMTIDQARQAAQQSVQAQAAPPPPGGGSGGSNDALLRYLNGTATTDDLQSLIQQGIITANEATTYNQKNAPSGSNPLSGLYAYDPQTGYISKQPADSEIGDSHFAGTVSTYIDPNTGILYDANGKALPEYLQKQVAGLGPGGSGSSGALTQYESGQLANNQAQLAEQQREFGITSGQNAQKNAQSYIDQRASAGGVLGGLVRNLANDQYQRALDPGNYPAYLASQAGMPQGSGSPITNLLGSGVQIQSPEGANPLADPRFQNLISQLYGYAQPQSLQTVQNIAQQNGGTLPQSFYDYTQTQNPVPAHAQGGSQMLDEPVIGIGLHSGQPKFLAGEAGKEKLTFDPVHSNETTGTFTKYADGGTATIDGTMGGSQPSGFTHHQLVSAYNAYHPNAPMADNIYTPAEGSAISLGKALQPLGYVPHSLIQQLAQGRAPTPESLNEQMLARLPASLRTLLGSTVQSFLGNSGLQDFNSELSQYSMPGVSSGTSASYA